MAWVVVLVLALSQTDVFRVLGYYWSYVAVRPTPDQVYCGLRQQAGGGTSYALERAKVAGSRCG